MEGFYIYALVSEKSGEIYVGMAKDCALRLKEHNNGKSRFTKAYIPWSLFYSEFVGETKKSREREKYFKTSAGKRRLKAILSSDKNVVLGSLPD
jgi:putative endonuclease